MDHQGIRYFDLAGALSARVEMIEDEAEAGAGTDYGSPWTMFERLTIDVKEP